LHSLLLTMFKTVLHKQRWTNETSSNKHFSSLLQNKYKRMESYFHSLSTQILWTQQTLSLFKAVQSNKISTIHFPKSRNLTFNNNSNHYQNDILSSKLIMTSLRQLYYLVLTSFKIISLNTTLKNLECINPQHRVAFVTLK